MAIRMRVVPVSTMSCCRRRDLARYRTGWTVRCPSVRLPRTYTYGRSPVNLVESIQPNVSLPFLTDGTVVDLKDTRTSFATKAS